MKKLNLTEKVRRQGPSLWSPSGHILVKRLIRGTFQGRFEPKYLQNYLDEFVFRFNRRKSKSIGKKFMRIVQQAVKSTKITYSEIQWDIDPISEFYAT